MAENLKKKKTKIKKPMRLKKSFKLHGSEGWGGMEVGVRDHRTMTENNRPNRR